MARKLSLGVDLGWVSQLEQMGYSWVDDRRNEVDPIAACKSMGANAVRMRIFVDPPRQGFWQKREDELCMLGFCDAHSVLQFSKRVKALGMDLMLDFHYSDHFADPVFQQIPEGWAQDDDEKLTERVYTHTKQVLQLFREHDLVPRWVQVGNEINPGIMLPHGSLALAPEQLVRFLNAGYDAVKEVTPGCLVITHVAGIHSEEWCVPFLDNFFARSGKTDILGFSYYPYWYQAPSVKEKLAGWLNMYQEKYGMPVMLVEVGGEDSDEQGTYDLLCDCGDAILEVPDQKGLGVFYWEPEVNREVLPDRYPLGAARLLDSRTLQYTGALAAYRKYG